jgi:hypothetical protein
VDRKDFGNPDRTGIDEAAKAAREAAKNFNDPTQTSAFKAAMGLAAERGASALGEVERSGRDAASRAGYTGGFNAAAKAANADRFKATAEAGFAGVASIRDQEADMYGKASGALASLMSAYNSAMTASNVAFATSKADQARAQATIDLGFSKMIQDKNLTFMDATNAAKMLQAQLDQAYNGSLIDNARYTQMSQSLAAQLASEQARLKEQGRQFDLGRLDQNRQFNQGRTDAADARSIERERLAASERQSAAERAAAASRQAAAEAAATGRTNIGEAGANRRADTQAGLGQSQLLEQQREFDISTKEKKKKASGGMGSTLSGIYKNPDDLAKRFGLREF